MELDSVFLYTALGVGILTLCSMLKNVNGWFYTIKFSSRKYRLPPGDMGWPFIGNMILFFKSFKSTGNPCSFVSYFVTRFGPVGMYKAYMFGSPSIIVTKPEICKKIFMDDDNFDRGKSSSVGTASNQEDKRLRRITTAHIRTHGSLSFYFDCINEIVKNSLEKFAAKEEPIYLFSELKKPAFEVLMLILIGGYQVSQQLLDVVFEETAILIRGFHGLPINIPGFAYNRAMKAQGIIAQMFKQILEERKVMIAENKARPMSNMLDMMLDAQDIDGGKGLSDETIVGLLLQYTFAGYESVAKVASKTIMHFEKHPDILQKAKEEQEEIVKRRPSSDAGLNFDEIRQMKYLSKVLDETLRVNSLIPIFRVAKATVNLNGYTIPKGWKFLTFLWSFNMDPETYVNPMEFNPSRWDDMETKPTSYFPFGVGPKMCPGSNVARLSLSIILQYFLLNYRFEQPDPDQSKTKPLDNCIGRFKKIST
ncbi:beta-amyrin 11-oxidase-like [Lycium barbarum]|uniref:beta-amyrin 11-oxidase-like n=1 Tax=Lycium barbarum TaxID=112863 RepID=UPI00293EA822|nr:beta-amyrin 11-oxidase-like [Lycium barbarum]